MTGQGQQTYIKVGPQGTFRRSGTHQTSPADIDGLFASLQTEPPDRLLLYFHGGLNKETDGLECADRIHARFQTIACSASFVWETGVQETVTQKLRGLGENPLFRKLRAYVASCADAYRDSLGDARGAGGGLSIQQAERELESPESAPERFEAPTPPPLSPDKLSVLHQELEVQLEADIEADEELKSLLERGATDGDPAVRSLLPAELEKGERGIIWGVAARGILKLGWRVGKRYFDSKSHGFYPTVVEEVLRELFLRQAGKWVWDGMKEKAERMWERNTGLAGDDLHVGTYFIEGLRALKQARPGLQIDLAGHSAGSIAICHLLTAMQRYPELSINNVFFLAPACTSDLMYREIVRQPGRFRHFCSFVMDDDHECRDHLVPGVYTRSLLYLVSGVFESEPDTPIAGLERHLRASEPYAGETFLQTRRFLTGPPSRLVLAPTASDAPLGSRCQAIAHGGFGSDEETLMSLEHLMTRLA